MDTKRDILQSVASGELTPEEAAERLAALETPVDEPAAARPEAAAGSLRRVRVLAELGSAQVIGDPTVADAVAEGDHTATRDGDTLTIELHTDDEDGDDGRFRFDNVRKHIVIGGKRRVSFGSNAKPMVTVRVNPRLALDADVGAGKLTVKDVHGPIKAEVAMGSLRVEGARAPFDVEVAMGSAHVQGMLDHGDAKVHCDMGAATITLAPGSSAKVRARTSMGKVTLPGVTPVAGIGGGTAETVVGDGVATLEIECAMGSVKVIA